MKKSIKSIHLSCSKFRRSKKSVLLILILILGQTTNCQEWSGIAVPANAGSGKAWSLQENVSDDFNYTFNAVNYKTNFGSDKWYNFYHNQWDGPGVTYWKNDHVKVDGDNLILRGSRWDKSNQSNPQYPYPGATEAYKMGKANEGVNLGCVTSNNRVKYPVFVESAISVANINLASCFWLLSPDDTQEIDIIENYGSTPWFRQFTHISHHSFIRNPFHDYQPRDINSWWPDSRVSDASGGWGAWAWNGGNRRYLRLGVYWITPNHFEYYIDGEIVRVMYHNAIATKFNGTWKYTYYNGVNPAGTTDQWGSNIGGRPTEVNGYSDVTVHATSAAYNFSTLQAANNASNGINVIDPGSYQNGTGFNKEMDIIINFESQSWLANDHAPSTTDLNDTSKNEMKVDWVRVYKPVTSTAVTGVSISPSALTLEPGAQGNVTGAVSPSNAAVKTMTFSSSNTNVATVNNSGVINAISNGTAIITAKSTDGGFTATSTVTVSAGASGETVVLEAESFSSTGGTFNDGLVPYGVNKGTSIINYVNTQDYAVYNLNISDAGEYSVLYKIATPLDNAQISIYVDNVLKGVDNVSNNGSWNNFQDLISSSDVSLSSGNHQVKIVASGSNNWQWNLDKIIFSKVGNIAPPVSAQIEVQAESFVSTTGTYNDGLVPFGMNKGASLVNYVNKNDEALYTITVTDASVYFISYEISTPMANAEVSVYVDGNLISTDPVVNNGSWGQFENLLASNSVYLSSGNHSVKIVASGTANWQWNMDKFTLSTSSVLAKGGKSLQNEIVKAKLDVRVFPNPVSDFVFVESSDTINSIKVFNSMGATVMVVYDANSPIDVSNLKMGCT